MQTPDFPLLGTVSHGTMRPQDLIPTFLDTIRSLLEDLPKEYLDLCDVSAPVLRESVAQDIEDIGCRIAENTFDEWCDTEDATYSLDSLFDILDALAPQDHYFGSHVGDGSDYGFWSAEDLW